MGKLGDAVSALELQVEQQTAKAVQQAEQIKALQAEIDRLKTPPAPAKPTRGASGALTTVKLDKPYAGKAVRLENLDIDANGLDRVVTLSRGQTVIIQNCRIRNVGRSVIEGHTEGSLIAFNRVTVERVPGYVVYVESRDANLTYIDGKAVNTVRIIDCDFGSSEHETPVRLMTGVRGEIVNTKINDTIDIGGNKANCGLRAHCYELYMRGCDIGKYAKFGYIHGTCRLLDVADCQFVGGIEVEGKIARTTWAECKLNGKDYPA